MSEIQEAAAIYNAARSAEEAPAPEAATPETPPQPVVADAAKAPETPPDPHAPPPEIDKRLSMSWQAISKRESALREQKTALDATAAEVKAAQTELAELRQLRAALKQDPVAVLDQHADKDWYQKATKRFIADPQGGMPADERIAQLEARLAKTDEDRDAWFEKRYEERRAKEGEAQKYQQQADDYTGTLRKLVDTDDRFEYTRLAPNGVDAVIELVNSHLRESNVLLSPEDAATLVEEELEKQYAAVAKAKKFNAAATAIAATNKQKSTSTQKAPSGPTTLTDNLSASGTPVRDDEADTPQDVIRNAAKTYMRLMKDGGV